MGFPPREGPLASDPHPQGLQSPQQRAPASSTHPSPRYTEALPPAHTCTCTRACTHTKSHAHTCTHRHILCQARCPPKSGLCCPLPWQRHGPTRDGFSPVSGPLGWERACGYGAVGKEWRGRPPSWLTNLETLNRGNRVLKASLPPHAGALGEGQERRKVVNGCQEPG